MSKTNEAVLRLSEAGAVAGEQTAFQSTGKEARQAGGSQEKNIVDKKSGIKKVNVEIVDEKMIALKKEKEAKTHELSLKSLDACVDSIRKEVDGISKSFCRIGFFLWKIREEGLYEVRGFRNVYEFGESVLNFKKSSTGNYINVCERFSKRDAKGRPTKDLSEDYCLFSFTQLTEVLSLPEGKEKEVSPEMSVREIRELKKASKKSEIVSVPDGSVSSNSFSENSSKKIPPVCLWDRVVTEENVKAFLEMLNGTLGKSVSVYIELEE